MLCNIWTEDKKTQKESCQLIRINVTLPWGRTKFTAVWMTWVHWSHLQACRRHTYPLSLLSPYLHLSKNLKSPSGQQSYHPPTLLLDQLSRKFSMMIAYKWNGVCSFGYYYSCICRGYVYISMSHRRGFSQGLNKARAQTSF